MSIKARLKRLQKKVAANEPPMRQLGMFAGKPIWKTEERDGIMHFVPIMSDEEYQVFARNQQSKLVTMCAAFAAHLEQADEAPVNAVILPDQLAPGAKRPNFIFRNEGGKEVQIEISTGRKTVV